MPSFERSLDTAAVLPLQDVSLAVAPTEQSPQREVRLSQVVDKVVGNLAADMRALGWRGRAVEKGRIVEDDGQLLYSFTNPEIIADLKFVLDELSKHPEIHRKKFTAAAAENLLRILMLAYIYNEAKRRQLDTNGNNFSGEVPKQFINSMPWKLAIILTSPGKTSDGRMPFRHFLQEARELRIMEAQRKSGDLSYNPEVAERMEIEFKKSFWSGEDKDDSYETPAIIVENQRVSFRKVMGTMLQLLGNPGVGQKK